MIMAFNEYARSWAIDGSGVNCQVRNVAVHELIEFFGLKVVEEFLRIAL